MITENFFTKVKYRKPFFNGDVLRMNVYYNENGDIWSYRHRENRLKEFPVNQTFLWEKQELFIPSIYIGKAGVVLDVCAKIQTEDMVSFLKKWNQERRISLNTMEEYEQMEAENPGCLHFGADLRLNHVPLTQRVSGSIVWYSQKIVKSQEDENDKEAEKLLKAYGCSRSSCWYFNRLVYKWKSKPLLSPQKIHLHFHTDTMPVTAGHFMTDISCNGEKIKAVHPKTRQEYILTLHEIKPACHSFAEIGKKDILYPEHFHILSYSISPEISREFLDIRDCSESDSPKFSDFSGKNNREANATSVFIAGKGSSPDRLTACSSLHFKPVSKIRWRIVFLIKEKEDIEVSFPLTLPV